MGILSMNSREFNDWADQKAESGVLKLIARWGMLAAIPMIMAAMTWIGSTLWALNTEQATLRGEMTGRIDVLTERIGRDLPRKSEIETNFKIRDYRIDMLDRMVINHGTRINRLEQK